MEMPGEVGLCGRPRGWDIKAVRRRGLEQGDIPRKDIGVEDHNPVLVSGKIT